ncbi:MAG: homoserine O-acetyltransferase, partial [bacterium]
DTHNVARGRKSIADALGQIRSKTLAVGISSDILFPPDDLKVITDHVQGCQYAEISSGYGHDGFLIEDAQLTAIIRRFYKS